MSMERLVDVQEELVDSTEAMITHMRRFSILCDKAKFPPELWQELNEFVVDWGNILTKYGDLLTEQGELWLPLLEDMRKDTIDELREIIE